MLRANLDRVLFAMFLALAAIGLIPGTSYKYLISEIMIWFIFAMAFDLLYGYTGQFSFGQALFFAMGSYGMALSILLLHFNIWLSVLVAILASAICAVFVGFLAVRVKEDHFVLITIIFSVIFFFLALDASWLTGGDQGLVFSPPPLLSLGQLSLSTSDVRVDYFLVLFFLILSYIVLRRIVDSPLGKIFVAIRENEERAKFLGYNVRLFKLVSFVIAGAFSGLSGALYSLTYMSTNARLFEISVSLKPIVWTLIGGAGTLVGPILGTVVVVLLETYVSFYWRYWPFVVGIFVVLFVRLGGRGRASLVALARRL